MWTYRLLETQENGETFLSLVEMYYDKEYGILGYTPVALEHFEDKRQIENALGLMGGALFKSVMFIDADGKIKEKV